MAFYARRQSPTWRQYRPVLGTTPSTFQAALAIGEQTLISGGLEDMYRKNTAGQHLGFGLVKASDGTALAGATVTGYRSIDGGVQAAGTGTVTDLGNGQYDYALSQADTNGNQISFEFAATSAIPREKTIVTTAANPTDAVRFGLTALPSGAVGSGPNSFNLDASGYIESNALAINSVATSRSEEHTF